MRQIPDQATKFIESFEGIRLKPYRDLANVLTIGIGHAIKPGENYNSGITREFAEQLLQTDLRIAARSIERLITTTLTDNQFTSLLSFVFNLGGGALQRSTLRKKINRGDPIDEICAEFLKWRFAGGKPIKGLLRRRIAESQLFRS